MTDQAISTTKVGAGKTAHEIITPPNKLKAKVKPLRQRPGQPAEDPVARAERELKKLEPQFEIWMEKDIKRLKSGWDTFSEAVEGGASVNSELVADMFHAAHDLKGQAATFGQPYIASVAASMCMILENESALSIVPKILIEQHVNAVIAIYREREKSHANAIAFKLSDELSVATKAFIVASTPAE
ncbi:MAG: Hpt domain-containing protein [Hyphomicrobiales bacterium]